MKRATAKKILCTLGPASLNPQAIKRLDELQVDLLRLNLSHTPVERIEELVSLIRAHSTIPICLDTQGAQVRTGPFSGGQVSLKTGTVVELVTAPQLGNEAVVPLYPASVIPQLAVGDLLTLDTSAVPLQVIEVGTTHWARVLNGGIVGSNKAASIDRTISLPHLTGPDRAAITLGLRLGIRNFALSFANQRSDVVSLREMVGDNVEIIAKIESRGGLRNLAEILKVSDAILIDRGDLSREVAIESMPFVQKEVIRQANAAQVPVYVATNLLESMVVSPRPNRAEANDVINTLLDGADGLVLAAETAIGKYPVQCVRMIQSMVRRYESRTGSLNLNGLESATSCLVAPHGDKLVQRVLSDYDLGAIQSLPLVPIDQLSMMDVTQIAIGTFSPLQGFMGREVLQCVLEHNRLPDGTVWPMPILLRLPAASPASFVPGETLALAEGGTIRALLQVEECFRFDLDNLAAKWFGTVDPAHPGVARLLRGSDRFVAGKVDLLSGAQPHRQPHELTPAQARYVFEHRQWQKVVGFHTRNVPHRAHEYLQFTALSEHQCDGIFIHPVIGPKKTGDFSGDIILKCYELLIDQFYAPGCALLGGFLTYSRYAGPREAVFTAICRQNFGCSHFIVGRDHTGVGNFYHPDASKRLFDEVGDVSIQPVFFDEVYYCEGCRSHVERCQHGRELGQQISGTLARTLLKQGKMPPPWYMREPVSALILEHLRNRNEVFAA